MHPESELVIPSCTLIHNVKGFKTCHLKGGNFYGSLTGTDSTISTVALTTGIIGGGIFSDIKEVVIDGGVRLKPNRISLGFFWFGLDKFPMPDKFTETKLQSIVFDCPVRITSGGKSVFHRTKDLAGSPVVAQQGWSMETGARIHLTPLTKDTVKQHIAFLQVDNGLTLDKNNAVHVEFVHQAGGAESRFINREKPDLQSS
ncbi:hypothetical protein CI610_01602 [invertebrate metagenome]|uniref:Uncharacterized protein n=1 Tax=invertebrate metagenome TaxID=1711999 RepID=A0A2H9T8C5_9ZZZZ